MGDAIAVTDGPAPPPLLEVRDLETGFLTARGRVRAVDGVSLSLAAGEALGIVGESGCGKSVLALSILRLVSPPGRITAGRILWRGEDLLEKPEREMTRFRGGRIAMVFQEPMTALNPVFAAGAQIAEAVRLHRGLPAREAMREAVRLLEQVAMPDPERRAREYPHQLSGGMRQRVLLAIALACRPALLIADEPTTALDVTIQAEILAIIRRLRREMGLAVLLITHDLGVIAGNADRVAVMYSGRIVEEAPVRDLLADPLHPYTRALLAARPREAGGPEEEETSRPGPTRRPLPVIPGAVPDPLERPSGCAFHPRCPEVHDRCRAEEPRLIGMERRRRVACFLHEGPAGR